MLLSFAQLVQPCGTLLVDAVELSRVVLAVWTLIRNYEARGEQLKMSHLICTEIRKLSILVVYCSGSLEVL